MKNDIQIQRDVVAELDREKDVIDGMIGVEVHHGVVKLAGHLDNAALRGRTELAARRVEGVTTVIMDVDLTRAGAASQSTEIDRTAPTI